MKNALFETERMWYRELTMADFDEVYKMETDPAVMRFLAEGKIRTDKEWLRNWLQTNFIDYYPKHPGLGVWPAIDKATGEMAGWFGLKHTNFDPAKEIEIGYRLNTRFWGKGYATEGASLMLHHGFNTLQLPEISANAHPQNWGSRRVLEKAGMMFYGYRHIYNQWLIYYLKKRNDLST